MDVSSSNSPISLAGQARSLFAEQALGLLPGLANLLEQTLVNMTTQPGNARTQQEARDALLDYQKNSGAWVQGTLKAWSQAAKPGAAGTPDARAPDARMPLPSGKLELLGDTAVEHRILASRLALRLLDFSSWELNDLRLRIQSLQGQAYAVFQRAGCAGFAAAENRNRALCFNAPQSLERKRRGRARLCPNFLSRRRTARQRHAARLCAYSPCCV